jgi:serine/threonine-protein kinase ULK/ATG1
LDIPRKINNISNVVENALRSMLVVEPKKRIDWNDLFNHPVLRFLDD